MRPPRKSLRPLVTVMAAAILFSSCTTKAVTTGPTQSSAVPSDCTGVDVASSPEKLTLLQEVAQTFNAKRVQSGAKCVFVRINRKSSGAGEQALAAGWDPAKDGPLPQIWTPAGGAWGAVLNTALSQRSQPEMV